MSIESGLEVIEAIEIITRTMKTPLSQGRYIMSVIENHYIYIFISKYICEPYINICLTIIYMSQV